jgi:prepilin-type N-terminal cleavage/methylation domain-containing protein
MKVVNDMLRTCLIGFTLAELLIALAILGEIATFTIPKIISSQQNGQKQAVTKELIAMVSGAYQQLSLKEGVTANTDFNDLLPYINYIAVDTTSIIDDYHTSTFEDCSATDCLKFANGAIVKYSPSTFGGTATTNAIYITIDPDGQYSGSTTGNGKGIRIFLYYNGRITSNAYILPNTCNSSNCRNPNLNADPPWFTW